MDTRRTKTDQEDDLTASTDSEYANADVSLKKATDTLTPPMPLEPQEEPKISRFIPNRLNSTKEFTAEIQRLLTAFDKNFNLSPYEGDVHAKRQALARDVASCIKTSHHPDTRKLELFNTAIGLFDHRSWPTLKGAVTTAVRYFKPTPVDQPAPVISSRSQNFLVTERDTLVAQMKSVAASRPGRSNI